MVPSRLGRAGTPRRGGFTLIELLIVVALMATVLVIGIRFNPFAATENELNAAARAIASTIDDARSESIVSGRRVFVEFDLGETRDANQHYRTIKEPLPGRERDAEDDEFMLTVREWNRLPDRVRIESITVGETEPWTDRLVRIAIQPDGTMPSHLIRLWAPELDPDRRRGGGWACIQVAGLLGQARVLNRYVEAEFLREDTFQ